MNSPTPASKAICAATLLVIPAYSDWNDKLSQYSTTPIQTTYLSQPQDGTLAPCSILNRRDNILQALEELRKEYAKPDWDGYGANPVSHQSIHNALCFVSHLPDTIEEPDVGCDADGEVTLEWYHDRDSQCLLTFGSDATIYCNQMANGARVAAQYRLADFDRIMSFVYEVASNV